MRPPLPKDELLNIQQWHRCCRMKKEGKVITGKKRFFGKKKINFSLTKLFLQYKAEEQK